MGSDDIESKAVLLIDEDENERTILEIHDCLIGDLWVQADILDNNRDRISLALVLTEELSLKSKKKTQLDSHIQMICKKYHLHDYSWDTVDQHKHEKKQYVVGITFFRTRDQHRLLQDFEKHLQILRDFYDSSDFDRVDEILGED